MKFLILTFFSIFCLEVFSQNTLILDHIEVSGMIYNKMITNGDTLNFLLLTSDYYVNEKFYFEVTFTDESKFVRPITSCGTIYKNKCYDICILYHLTKGDLNLFQTKNIESFKSSKAGIRKIDIRDSETFRKQLK
jgi:hypothetical protein